MEETSRGAEPGSVAARVEEGGTVRVLTVVGTRPEAIKMAPVLAALAGYERVDSRLALTGQHTDLVDPVLEAFDLEPDYDLGIMREGQTLYDVAHGCLEGLRDVVHDFSPAALLVQGDTGSVFYGALVGFFERVRVGHVEAGLRSGRKWAPYPEEMFRRLTDVLSDWYFAPTPAARANLVAEGIEAGVHVTGNTVVDALRDVAERLGEARDEVLADLVAAARSGDRRLALMTAHRRESFGEPLRAVFGAVREAADRHPELDILYPVHPNPNVREPAEAILADHPRVHLTDPLGYLDLVLAMKHADLVLTDSGGIQEEAPAFGVPVLVLRDVTERPEGVEAGVARLVGTDPERILDGVETALAAGATAGLNPYGDGRAGRRIADIVTSDLLGTPRRTTDWSGAP